MKRVVGAARNGPALERLKERGIADTTVRMLNSGISTNERRDGQDEGWRGCFDELERLLAR